MVEPAPRVVPVRVAGRLVALRMEIPRRVRPRSPHESPTVNVDLPATSANVEGMRAWLEAHPELLRWAAYGDRGEPIPIPSDEEGWGTYAERLDGGFGAGRNGSGPGYE